MKTCHRFYIASSLLFSFLFLSNRGLCQQINVDVRSSNIDAAATQDTGRVVVDIRADKAGNVVYAKAGAEGTTITDQKLFALCEENAKSYKVSALASAPDLRNGRLTYKFGSKKSQSQVATQDTDKAGVADLIRQGVALNDQGKYADAISKYNEALKIDPENIKANYEMAFTLSVSGKGTEGITYIEKAIKNSTSNTFTAACYEVLGSIYDDSRQPQKAVDAYKEGIKIAPDYQRLYFNLGITYSRDKKYPEAEAVAIKAIQLDPKHASSQRLYALVEFHQDKRANALEAFCSFIMLEPNTARSAEAYGNIQHILQGGVLKGANGQSTIMLSPKDKQEDQTLNMAISMATLAGQSKKLRGAELLEYELKAIFGVAGELAEKKTDKTFFDKAFAAYFYQLSKSNNMPAFARLISISANKDENTKWLADNAAAAKELDNWIANTPRDFKGD